MPTVEYSTKDLITLLGKPQNIERLAQDIPMMGVDLADINEERLCVEIFPNRPDMLSIEGFSRALKGFLSVEQGFPMYTVGKSRIFLNVDASVLTVRPCVAAACAYDVPMDDETVKSIMDMQEKLHLTHGRNRMKVSIGVHDMERVKPPFTYKAVKPDGVSFVPLDMAEKMNLKEILRAHPKGRDFAHILDGKTLYPLFVDSRGDVLSFPPIINGELTKITENTRNLFIELTGTDQPAVDIALNIVCASLADRGAKIEAVDIRGAG